MLAFCSQLVLPRSDLRRPGRCTLTETAVAINVLVLAAICVRYFFIQCLAASGVGVIDVMPAMMDGFCVDVTGSSCSRGRPLIWDIASSPAP